MPSVKLRENEPFEYALRRFKRSCEKAGVRVHYPELHLCTDNGAMIAMAAAMRVQSGKQQAELNYGFDVKPRWPLSNIVAALI